MSFDSGALGYKVVYVFGPVLNCGISDSCMGLDHDFNYSGVEGVFGIYGGRATFDVVDLGTFIGPSR